MRNDSTDTIRETLGVGLGEAGRYRAEMTACRPVIFLDLLPGQWLVVDVTPLQFTCRLTLARWHGPRARLSDDETSRVIDTMRSGDPYGMRSAFPHLVAELRRARAAEGE